MGQDLHRRQFIKNTGAAAALTLLGTKMPVMAHPQESVSKIVLFQGDSITEGGRWQNSTDQNHVMGQDYAYMIAGQVGFEHPEKDLTFYNRGISGNTLADLAARWDQDTLALKPGLLSIMVGVNDAYQIINQNKSQTAVDFKAAFQALLNRTKAALPNVQFVLIEPFVLPVGHVKEKIEAWQSVMAPRQAAVKEIAGGADAIFIPMQTYFNDALKKAPANHWIWDGVHPMPAGHQLMAYHWLKAVRGRLF